SQPAAAPLPERSPEQKLSVTRHRVVVNGRPLAYTATTGYMVMRDEDGKHRANVFFVAYTKDGADLARRPVTFTYNGGPGSSSVWLHMGALGPKRVLMSEKGEALPPPYRMVDNEHTWLDETDLVFIDPVTTGFSRAAPGQDPRQFHGFQEDLESVGAFIRLYATRYGRWSSPKFLAGESYGTTRSAGLAGHLQDRYGLYLNGVLLISSILNFQTARFEVGNDLPYPLFLPTYTATAWYHRRLPADLQARPLRQVLDEVEAFALRDYTLALTQGDGVAAEERQRVTRQLARYTGLTPEYVERSNLRVTIGRFVKELLRDQRRTVGRLDSRFQGIDRDAAGESYEFDPSLDATITGPYTATLNDYVRRELRFENDLPYEILTGRVQPWNYNNVQNRYLNVAETLRQAMSKNPGLKVFVASGYYDLATPYFATDYTVGHLGLDPALRDNVQVRYYEAGHMMYIHHPSLVKLTQEAREFLRSASNVRQDGVR
ncbi:MAG: peptidase S10, partial [Gemmatimonadota bacterium]|nr:peptidase S10 [Gemmatimonadota bacterium]